MGVSGSDYVIDVNHLQKSFANNTAVFDFSLKAKRGEIIGFLGPNGSGKTTTIRMLCGLLSPDAGTGNCLGYDLMAQSQQIRSHVGYMTQKFSLYNYLTIKQNLHFIARALDVVDPKPRVSEIINRLNLKKREDQRADSLSGGWKQRLALAAAILHHPKLLLLDEPTAGVDPHSRHQFWDIINDLAHEGITILVSTHYMDEAERCNRIVYLAYGKLIVQGTADEIIASAKLYSWHIKGEHLNILAKKLLSLNGIDQVTHFGSYLHVLGKNKEAMQSSLHPYLLDLKYSCKEKLPTLEDAFINLIANLKDERFD